MGTRHLICVFADGEYKVAQYGQWDGYPEGQGIDCLEFLRDRRDSRFEKNVKLCREFSGEEWKAIRKKYGEREDGSMRLDDYDRMSKDYPQLSRDTSSDVLEMIQCSDGGLQLVRDLDFAADSLFCEWAYVIDIDHRTFEEYRGFNREPLEENDRFYFLESRSENGYHPVKLVGKWSLDDLPSNKEFCEAFQEC